MQVPYPIPIVALETFFNAEAERQHLERLREARIARARSQRRGVASTPKPQQAPPVDRAAIDAAVKAERRRAVAELPWVKAAVMAERQKASKALRAGQLAQAMRKLRGIA